MAAVIELGRFTGFTLDSPTQGILDTDILDGGIAFTAVSSDAVSVSVSRGKNRDLDRTQAGVASIEFRNESADFDPENSGSVFQEFVVPRRPVRIFADGSAIFRGLIDDWNLTYNLSGEAIASLDASDEFSLFARQNDASGSAPEEDSNDRLERVLDQSTVQWPADRRDIQQGDTSLGAGVLEGNALSYIQQIDASEQGLIFMSKDGDVAFRPRLVSIAGTAIVFSDTGNGVPYQQVLVTYGSETLANRSTVSSAYGTATAQNLTSQVVYGITERDFDTLLASQNEVAALADYIVARYGEPEYRFENITVNMNALTSLQKADVLGAEIGDQVEMNFTPPGASSAISQRSLILGIKHNIGIDDHFVSFSLQELPFQFFILDDPEFGILDGDALLGF